MTFLLQPKNLKQGLWIILFSLTTSSTAILPVSAAPLVTDLTKILSESSAIAVGQCLGTDSHSQKYKLDVKKVLRGKLPLGRQLVSYVPNQTPRTGSSPCVAFLDKQGRFQFAAVPVDSEVKQPENLNQSLLAVVGFYDYSAHVITPHFITLAQIENYLKTGKFVYKINGHILFFSLDQKKIVPSKDRIVGEYELFSETSIIKETPQVAGLGRPLKLKLASYMLLGSGVSLDYGILSTTGKGRGLSLSGEAVGMDKATGEVLVNFSTLLPLLYTESDFQRYISDAKLGRPQFNVSITLPDKTQWKLVLGGEEPSKLGTLAGFRDEVFSVPYGLSTDSSGIRLSAGGQRDEGILRSEGRLSGRFRDQIRVPLNRDGALFLAVDPSTLSRLSRHIFFLTNLGLLETLVQHPVDCMVRVEGGSQPMPRTACQMRLDDVQFTPVSE